MNISRVMKYLISGIVIGAVLFFAAFGVMNLLNDSSEITVKKPATQAPATQVTQPEPSDTPVEVSSPSIEVNSISSQVKNGQGTSDSPIKIKPLGSNEAENEAVKQEEVVSQTAAFGTLTLSTVNSQNGQSTPADFMIENSEGVAIALVKDTASSTLSLPAGDYKITVSQGQSKLVRFLGVKEGHNGSEVFELDVPVLAGETTQQQSTPASQTPAKDPKVNQASATQTTSVQETVGSDTEESSEMASENPEADGVDRPATEASEEVTVATADKDDRTKAMGGLRVSALTKVGNRPTNASFYIQKLNGENIENVKGVSTQQFNLPAGTYRVTARKGTARVVAEVKVVANRGMHEIFHIPEVPAVANNASTQVTVAAQNTETVSAPSQQPATLSGSSDDNNAKTGHLELFSQTATNNKSIKSNFYVQTTAGKLVANKTYVDSIGYKLPAGKYKVTVRSTGYVDKTVELFVREGQVRRQIFKMQPKNQAPAASVQPAPAVVQQAPAQAAPLTSPAQNRENRRGGLQVNIVSAETGQGLVADISVHRASGREVRRAEQASSARFDLPPREFVLRVNYGGLITNQKVTIRSGKLAIKTISFEQAN